jgi:ATP-dependent protease Clp ATPase subunit
MQPNLQRMNEHKLIRMMKSNIMLVGPSGVGKTYVIKVLADALDVPMAHCDWSVLKPYKSNVKIS